MVIVWNAGTEAIQAAALATSAPFRVTIPSGVEVLDVSVLPFAGSADGVVVGWSPTPPRTDLPITFGFMNAETGFVIQVVHTGAPDQLIGLAGTLVDVPPLIHVAPTRWWTDRLLVFASMVVAVVAGVGTSPFPVGTPWASVYVLGWIFGFGLLFPIGIGRLGWTAQVRMRPPGILKSFAATPVTQRG